MGVVPLDGLRTVCLRPDRQTEEAANDSRRHKCRQKEEGRLIVVPQLFDCCLAVFRFICLVLFSCIILECDDVGIFGQ